MEHPAGKPDTARWAAALACAVAGFAVCAIVGWTLGERRLVALFAGNAAMKYNQAIALLLLATALALRARQSALRAAMRPPARILASVLGAVALAIATISLAEYVG